MELETAKKQAKKLIPTEVQAVILGLTVFAVALCIGLAIGSGTLLWLWGAGGAVVFSLLINFVIDMADRATKKEIKNREENVL